MSRKIHPESKTRAWNLYWSSGRVAACSGDSDGNYYPEIKQRWMDFFSGLSTGDHLLDIATGNGAVIALALDYAESSDCSIKASGVDIAEISPAGFDQEADKSGSTVAFYSQTPAERLPFADASVDMATSQYALEYSDLQVSLEEAARVLKPGGCLMMISHTIDSAIMDQTRLDLEDGGFVLNQYKVLDAFRDLVQAESDGKQLQQGLQGSSGHSQAKQVFTRTAAVVSQRIAGRTIVQSRFLNGLMSSMGEIYQHRYQHDYAEVIGKINTIREETLAHQQRLTDMQEAALDPVILDQLRTRHSHHYTLEIDEAVQDGAGFKLGHQLVFRRR